MTTVVHIGYWKTGTTALQRQFFPVIPSCEFVTRGNEGDRLIFRILGQNLCDADDHAYLEQTLRAFLEEKQRLERHLVISHEALAGTMYEGGYNRFRNARRLRSLLPEAKILIVVRHQATMIRSVYSFYVQKGGSCSFAEFVGGRSSGDFDSAHLCYDVTVEDYQKLFGRHNVKVLAYETLVRDPPRFLADVVGFIDPSLPVPETTGRLPVANRSLSPASRWALRHSNRVRRSYFNPEPMITHGGVERLGRVLQQRIDPLLFPRVQVHLRRRDQALIEGMLGRYEESNARLQELADLPLAALGYPLPQAGEPRETGRAPGTLQSLAKDGG